MVFIDEVKETRLEKLPKSVLSQIRNDLKRQNSFWQV